MTNRVIPNLPHIDQVGFVVQNLMESVRSYEMLFGEFSVWEPTYIEGASYRGESADCTLHIATVQNGSLEIELIQALEGSSPHVDATERRAFGMHHVRYRIKEIENYIKAAQSCGYEVIWYKQWDEATKFGYLERVGDPLIIEFLEMP